MMNYLTTLFSILLILTTTIAEPEPEPQNGNAASLIQQFNPSATITSISPAQVSTPTPSPSPPWKSTSLTPHRAVLRPRLRYPRLHLPLHRLQPPADPRRRHRHRRHPRHPAARPRRLLRQRPARQRPRRPRRRPVGLPRLAQPAGLAVRLRDRRVRVREPAGGGAEDGGRERFESELAECDGECEQFEQSGRSGGAAADGEGGGRGGGGGGCCCGVDGVVMRER